MPTFTLDPGALRAAYDDACRRLDSMRAVDGLWREDVALWSDRPEVQRVVGNRLGWLRALDAVEPEVPRLRAFADAVRREGVQRVVLMGMGGSSLAPEVLRHVVGVASGFPRFAMVDTVNPDAVRAVFTDTTPTLFVMASKSGGTIEPTVLAAEARRVASAHGHWGPRTVAITDPDTALHQQAKAEGFREVFVNPADIGGRYSALSLFGMVPAALMGADLGALIVSARRMATACQSQDIAANPGFQLGALMAAAAAAGRDKLTLLLPPSCASFGLWVEQLVGESTGKQGVGVIPVTGEPDDATFGPDRCFVVLTCRGEQPSPDVIARARASGAPVVDIEMPQGTDLSAEFFRWEVATAVAGLLLGVNPFDEPNVAQAKAATRQVLDEFARQGALPTPDVHDSIDGARLTLSRALLGRGTWKAAATSLTPHDYLALLAYAPPDDVAFAAALDRARARLGSAGHVATTAGFGPRYLHSTGQLHKGGPNTGVFVIVTATADEDMPAPGYDFSFGQLEAAQALGDYRTLDDTGRRVAYIHLARRDPALLDRVIDAMTTAN